MTDASGSADRHRPGWLPWKVFRNGISIMHHAWNEWYRAYLREYGETVDSLISDVETYLGR